MRETRADTTFAVVFALLLHAVPLLLLLLAAFLPSRESASAGEPISADVVDINALSANMRNALQRAPEPLREAQPEPTPPQPQVEPPQEPPPLPEALNETTPPPQQLQAQEQIPQPDQTQQEEVRPDAQSEDTAEREQDAKRIQGQRDLTDRERQEEVEQRLKMTEMERQRQQQLADIRRQRAEATRDAQLAEERLKQLADRRAREASDNEAASANPPPGNRGADPNLKGAYAEAIADAIRRNWVRPDNVPMSQVCKIVIKQIPGGQVIDAQVDPSCPYDEIGRRSVEAAVLKAQPLPYAGFESVFDRTLILKFRAEDR